jgi:hypothetical protein
MHPVSDRDVGSMQYQVELGDHVGGLVATSAARETLAAHLPNMKIFQDEESFVLLSNRARAP